MATATNHSELSMMEHSIKELQRMLEPVEQYKRITEEEAKKHISLGSFVENTSDIILEPWQNHLCQRLERLSHQTGQRILIHKPPQHGGSVIVSQRLPAYLIGTDPTRRVRLACYNIEHATKFTGINKNIMTSGEYKAIFADPTLYVHPRASDEEFYTVARKRVRDAQSSLMALGLRTGFVGQGADDLIIDDPYASPQDAESPAVRSSTWMFWEASARVRIDANTNVIVMFHRYNEEDFVGQLIQEEGLKSRGGAWELLSYRAEWDADVREEVGGDDPIGRDKGEFLSPRKAAQPGYYEGQKKNPKVWQSQFQGKPSNAEGSFFLVNKFIIVPRCTTQLVKVCLAWDIASSVNGDWTVGVLMGLGVDELVYVISVCRFRKVTDERNAEMLLFASTCRVRYPDLVVRVPQDPAAAGRDLAASFQKLFKGFNLVIEGIRGDKETRADPWSQYVNAGHVRLVSGSPYQEQMASWIKIFIEEHRKFPNSVKKDQVDASSDAFAEVALAIDEAPGEDFDTVGLAGGDDGIEDAVDEAEHQMLLEIMGQQTEVNYYGNQSKEETSSSSAADEYDPTRNDYSTLRERKNARQIKERRFLNKRPNKH